MKMRVAPGAFCLLLASAGRTDPWGCTGFEVDRDASVWHLQPAVQGPCSSDQPGERETFVLGPFDEKTYGFRRVEFQATEHDPGLDARPDAEGGIEVPYFCIHLKGPDESRWVLSATHHFSSPFGDWQPRVDEVDSAAGPKLPIFLLWFSHVTHGPNTIWEWSNRTILDFRHLPPKVLAHFECMGGEPGGYCQAPDMANSKKGEYSCTWSDEQSDFLCSHTLIQLSYWNDRAFTTCFLLEKGSRVPCPRSAPGIPSDLGELAERLRKGTARIGDSFTLPGAGTVRALAAFQGYDGITRYLLAGPGAKGGSDLRFYLATTNRGSPASIAVIDWLTVDCTAEFSIAKRALPKELEGGTPVDPPPGFELVGIDAKAGFHLFRLVVTEGNKRSLVWVGVDTRRQPSKAEALLLAADRPDYAGCGAFYLPPQLAPRDVRVSPFRAEMLFMEGLRTTPPADDYTPWCRRSETEDYTDAVPEGTPTHAVLAWDPDDGFMLEVTRWSRDTSDRWGIASIDKRGNVTFEQRVP